jgi:hypothetical protein
LAVVSGLQPVDPASIDLYRLVHCGCRVSGFSLNRFALVACHRCIAEPVSGDSLANGYTGSVHLYDSLWGNLTLR